VQLDPCLCIDIFELARTHGVWALDSITEDVRDKGGSEVVREDGEEGQAASTPHLDLHGTSTVSACLAVHWWLTQRRRASVHLGANPMVIITGYGKHGPHRSHPGRVRIAVRTMLNKLGAPIVSCRNLGRVVLGGPRLSRFLSTLPDTLQRDVVPWPPHAARDQSIAPCD